MSKIATNYYMGDNLLYLTKYEFAAIISYLTSKVIYPLDCIPIMKKFKSITNIGFYIVSQKEAWDYFKDKYGLILKHRGISEMPILLNRAVDYAFDSAK